MVPTTRILIFRGSGLALAFGLLMAASSMNAQTSERRSARSVQVRIETDRAAYRVGEPVKVRLVLRNTSSFPLEFRDDSPRGHVRLLVTDESGRHLEANPRLFGQALEDHPPPIALRARQERTLQWAGSEWMNLSDWGYVLRAPGEYSIEGIPFVAGPKIEKDHKTIRSNKAKIIIKP